MRSSHGGTAGPLDRVTGLGACFASCSSTSRAEDFAKVLNYKAFWALMRPTFYPEEKNLYFKFQICGGAEVARTSRAGTPRKDP